MSEISLTGIHSYPIKSTRGISLDQATLVSRGLEYDRRWMLVDSQGQFLTQRQLPRMALIHTHIEPDALLVRTQGHSDLVLPLELNHGEVLEVQVWKDQCRALAANDEINEWFSQVLHHPVRLVFMPDDMNRQVDPNYARSGDITSFADGFPLLLISEGSLADLNQRLDSPLPMRRFRPNLVVKGCSPYAEDQWQTIRIGGILFELVKPCSRCNITTVDPETAVRHPDREPLKTLATYRKKDKQVFFGQNLIHRETGLLRLGDTIEIIESS